MQYASMAHAGNQMRLGNTEPMGEALYGQHLLSGHHAAPDAARQAARLPAVEPWAGYAHGYPPLRSAYDACPPVDPLPEMLPTSLLPPREQPPLRRSLAPGPSHVAAGHLHPVVARQWPEQQQPPFSEAPSPKRAVVAQPPRPPPRAVVAAATPSPRLLPPQGAGDRPPAPARKSRTVSRMAKDVWCECTRDGRWPYTLTFFLLLLVLFALIVGLSCATARASGRRAARQELFWKAAMMRTGYRAPPVGAA